MNSNSQLQSSVLEELKWRPSVNATHIGVTEHDQAGWGCLARARCDQGQERTIDSAVSLA